MVATGTELVVCEAEPHVYIAPSALRQDIADAFAAAGVRVIVEHGVITAECQGVEVARVTGAGDEQRLDVGVGAYDQGAFAVMNPGLTPNDALQQVVDQVAQHRQRGAPPHPLSRIVRERWLRAELLDGRTDEGPLRELGLSQIMPVEPAVARTGLYDTAPAFATAIDSDGQTALVAFSVGIDPGLAPHAADVAARENVARVVFVLPARDRHPATMGLIDRMRLSTVVIASDEPWSGGEAETVAGSVQQ